MVFDMTGETLSSCTITFILIQTPSGFGIRNVRSYMYFGSSPVLTLFCSDGCVPPGFCSAIDVTQAKPQYVDWRCILFIVKCLEAYYPEGLHLMCIHSGEQCTPVQ